MAASRGDHARILPGTMINNRYEVSSEMGRGNFSVVYGAKDKLQNNAIVALKFVKKEYAHDAKFEHDILKAIRDANPTGVEKVLMMIDHFAYNRHPCFVLAPKGCPLKARRLGIRDGHVSRNELRCLTKQMCEALSFLHFKMKLVHTDLKPENILLDNNLPSGAKGLGEGFTIVDFGSASFYRMDRLDSDLISTRPYRSPEVVLGNGWYYPADTWSLGCILYEVYTGHKLFDVSDDHVHLAHMYTRLGAMPKVFTHDSQNSRRFFDSNGQLLKGNALRSAPYIKAIQEELRDDKEFADLIISMLAYEPSRRIRCDDALRHPFITGGAASSSSSSSKPSSPLSDIPSAPAMRKDTAPLGTLHTNTQQQQQQQYLRPVVTPVTSSSSSNNNAYDKENLVRVSAVPVNKPLYNNIRLPSSTSSSTVSSAHHTPAAGPLTARSTNTVSSSSLNPYGLNAPLSARPSSQLISPAAGASNMYRTGSSASTSSSSLTAQQQQYLLEAERMNALKRTKSDPSLMPVAGRASGVQYSHRIW